MAAADTGDTGMLAGVDEVMGTCMGIAVDTDAPWSIKSDVADGDVLRGGDGSVEAALRG